MTANWNLPRVYKDMMVVAPEPQTIHFGSEVVHQENYGDETLFASPDFLVMRHTSNYSKSVTSSADIPEAWGQLVFVLSGTCLFRLESDDRWYLMPHNFLGLPVPGKRYIIRKGRGQHTWISVSWRREGLETISNVLERLFELRVAQLAAIAAPYRFTGSQAERMLERIRQSPINVAEAKILCIVGECIARLTEPIRDPALRWADSQVIPDCFMTLIRDVVAKPDLTWSLQEASAHAGYSAFHFSRLFKQIVGTGFHEFVDRVRTASAAEFLMSGQGTIDTVATLAGFGSQQSLRDSLRDYYGMVPSDLKSEPAAAYYS